MASRKAELDDELKQLHWGPLFGSSRGPGTLSPSSWTRQEEEGGGRGQVAGEADAVGLGGEPALRPRDREDGPPARAGERARAAQREAVAGAGPERLRETMAAARDLAEELRQRAAAILSEDGRAPSRAMMDRVATNLQALAFSPAAAEEASRGWLSRDLDPPGFEVFTGLEIRHAS